MNEAQGDLTSDAVVAVAQRLDVRAAAQGLRVCGALRRSWRQMEVVEGLHFGDRWTDVFEPVRRRRMLGARWYEMQPVADATSTSVRSCGNGQTFGSTTLAEVP